MVAGGESVTLQTLGGRGRLRGILAFGDVHGPDQASEQVVTSVIALAGLALEQNHTLDRVRGNLRTGMWRLLLAGDVALVDEISRQSWGPLPAEPFVVALADAPAERLEPIVEYIELRAESGQRSLFYAVTDDSIVFCADPAHPIFDDLTTKFSLPLGRSAPTTYAELNRALRQAEQAHRRAVPSGAGMVDFQTVSGQGVLALMAGAAATEVARSILEPLLRHDATSGTALVSTVRTWLAANGEFEAASRTLGVHRHTVRARIARSGATAESGPHDLQGAGGSLGGVTGAEQLRDRLGAIRPLASAAVLDAKRERKFGFCPHVRLLIRRFMVVGNCVVWFPCVVTGSWQTRETRWAPQQENEGVHLETLIVARR